MFIQSMSTHNSQYDFSFVILINVSLCRISSHAMKSIEFCIDDFYKMFRNQYHALITRLRILSYNPRHQASYFWVPCSLNDWICQTMEMKKNLWFPQGEWYTETLEEIFQNISIQAISIESCSLGLGRALNIKSNLILKDHLLIIHAKFIMGLS